jgi:hypothetical protein
MSEVVVSREAAQPLVDAVKQAFLLDDLNVHVETRAAATRNTSAEIVVWFAVSILSHAEILRLADIARATQAKGAILPDDKSQMKVELSVPLPAAR